MEFYGVHLDDTEDLVEESVKGGKELMSDLAIRAWDEKARESSRTPPDAQTLSPRNESRRSEHSTLKKSPSSSSALRLVSSSLLDPF